MKKIADENSLSAPGLNLIRLTHCFVRSKIINTQSVMVYYILDIYFVEVCSLMFISS